MRKISLTTVLLLFAVSATFANGPQTIEVLEFAASGSPKAGDGFALVVVVESDQNGWDWNYDGDALDRVLQVVGPSGPVALVNTGADPLWGDSGYDADGRAGVFSANENVNPLDLNLDGDQTDFLLGVYNHGNGQLSYLDLGTTVAYVRVADPFAYVALTESTQDFNGDGDFADQILHVVNLTTGAIRNLALPGPTALSQIAVSDKAVTSESKVGTDWNGDGDLDDDMIHVHHVASNQTHRCDVAWWRLGGLEIRGTLAVFRCDEGDEGVDLTGDADEHDQVPAAIDARSGAVSISDMAGGRPLVGEDRWVWAGSEYESGRDLNGDGDLLDEHVLHGQRMRKNQPPGAVVNFGINARPLAMSRLTPVPPLVTTKLLAAVDEQDLNLDLNGDGDMNDEVASVGNMWTNTCTPLGFSLPTSSTQPGTVLQGGVYADETQDGTDHNGDGDTADSVLFTVNMVANAWTNHGIAVADYKFAFAMDNDLIAVLVSEAAQGGVSLNGDATDNVAFFVDARAGTTLSAGYAVDRISHHLDVATGVAWIFADEALQGQNLNPFWGDTDTNDRVLVSVR